MTFLVKLTTTGAAKIAAADAGGAPVQLTHMAAGDGGGAAVAAPTGEEEELVNEVWRDALTSLAVSLADPTVMIAEAIILSEDGGFAVREIGVFDGDGDLFAYGNFPETWKPVAAEGSSREMLIQASIRVASTENVEIVIDPSLVLATRQWCDGRFLRIGENLSDVADAAAALANLGGAPIAAVEAVAAALDAHVGSGGPAHAVATGDAAGFMAAADKAKLDGMAAGYTQIGSPLSLASGNSWSMLPIPDDFQDLMICFSGISHSGAGSRNFTVAHTSDGGGTWSAQLAMNAFAAADLVHGAVSIFNYRSGRGLIVSGLHASTGAPSSGKNGDLTVFGFRADAPINGLRWRWSSNDTGDAGSATLFGR